MPVSPRILVIEDDPLYRTLYAKSIMQLCPAARLSSPATASKRMNGCLPSLSIWSSWI